MKRVAALAAWLTLAPGARAAEGEALTVLRMATVAPDGTPQARELRTFARNVESRTAGRVHVKWYFGGIAGDEWEQGERIKSGQLDGSASVNMLLEHVAPTMLVNRLPGLLQSRDEAVAVMNGLHTVFEEDAHRAGYTLLATASHGAVVLFSRVPVHSLTELRQLRIWRWSLDELGIAASRAMGMQIVPVPISDAARAFDEGRIDAFWTVPGGAIAFQWSTRGRYLIDLQDSFLPGGILVAERAFAALPVEDQEAVRSAAAMLRLRYDKMGEQLDAQLLGGLLQKQGVVVVPVSDRFRAEFAAAAQAAREQIATRFVPKSLLERMQLLLLRLRGQRASATRVVR